MTPAYTAQLGLKVQKTNLDTRKIDKFLLKIYKMVISAFQVLNKPGCFWSFQEIFSVANISMKIILGMIFLIFSNADI